ncbi:hypothetical protein BD410DRAFT_788800 [Rickenella mellea]|uniref:Mid2 domain-containing protein n=1 Tax=Rickenella mellea TaxID=50990 RepID=A0A4Y7Q382_9AGAM|nr:hypothetical protein BD410DRAFT_788800 [Rickenella mellea]
MLAAILFFLASGTQAVLGLSDFITFSTVQQCAPFLVNFSGERLPAQFPLSLTVIPFKSAPISISISNSSLSPDTDNGTVSVTFLPLPAGATFIASLDDAQGKSTGVVSDIVTVQPSDDSSCLPTNNSTPHLFKLQGDLSQCQPFTVEFDDDVVDGTPSIRAFIPGGSAVRLHQSGKRRGGKAMYGLNVSGGQRVAFLFSDNKGHAETTNLMAVNSSSMTKCLQSDKNDTQQTSVVKHQHISRAGIIMVGVLTGGIVGSVLLMMALLVRRRQRRWRAMNPEAVATSPTSYMSSNSKSFGLSTDIYLSTAPPSRAGNMSSIHSPSHRLTLDKFGTKSVRSPGLQSITSHPPESEKANEPWRSVDHERVFYPEPRSARSISTIDEIASMLSESTEIPRRPPPVVPNLTVTPTKTLRRREPDAPISAVPHMSLMSSVSGAESRSSSFGSASMRFSAVGPSLIARNASPIIQEPKNNIQNEERGSGTVEDVLERLRRTSTDI